MAIVTGNVSLAPFAHDWVGGDISGLARLAETLHGCAPQATGVAVALDAQVRLVVSVAGWQGSAASAFSSSWGKDSATARAVGIASNQVAGIVGWLATALSLIEAQLEGAATEATAHGVPVDAQGAPLQICYASPAGAGQAAAQQWLTWYQRVYQQCMHAAQAAREQAATTLVEMARQIVSNASGRRPADIGGDAATVAGLLADLLAGKSSPQMEDVIKAIEKAWYGSGSHTHLGRDNPGAEGDDGGLESLGLIDVLSAGINTGLNVYEDVHYYHKPLLESLYVESVGSGVGLLLPQLPKLMSALKTAETAESEIQYGGAEGGEADGEVAAGETAADGVDPLALAGIVANDDIHNAYLEPWSADVHDQGVVMGLVNGYGDVVVNTFENLEGMVTENTKVSLADVALDHEQAVGKAAERAWNDLPWNGIP